MHVSQHLRPRPAQDDMFGYSRCFAAAAPLKSSTSRQQALHLSDLEVDANIHCGYGLILQVNRGRMQSWCATNAADKVI